MAKKNIVTKTATGRKPAKKATPTGNTTPGRKQTQRTVKGTESVARAAGKSSARKPVGARKAAPGTTAAASRKTPPASTKKAAAGKVTPRTRTAAKKLPAKKSAVPQKTAAKKSAPKKAAPKKPIPAKSTAPKTAVSEKAASARPKTASPARKPKTTPKATAQKPAKGRRFSAREMEFYRRLLLELRDRVVDGITFLAGENLNNSRDQSGDLSNYGIHMADHGTDSFDRELALSMVSNEQDLIYEIDEALARIESGTYGICEMTGEFIERERLKIIPYARFCVKAQEEMERGRSRFRPFSASFARGGSDLT